MTYSPNQSKYPSLLDLPESERPRGKLLAQGAAALSNAELLAVLLSSSKFSDPVMVTATRIMTHLEQQLMGLASLEPEELMQIRGVGPVNACRLCAAAELGKRLAEAPARQNVRMDRPEIVAKLFTEELRHCQQEIFMVALLNVKTELMTKARVSMGGLSSASALAREVFALAVKKGAYAIILVHNHPSGDPTPSKEDLQVTQRLAESGKILGIQVLDHLIIGDGKFTSFREQGLLL